MNTGNVRVWRGPALAIEPARLLRVHRYTDPRRVRPPIRAAAEQAVARAAPLAAPGARLCRLPVVSCSRGVLVLGGGHRFTCEAFDHLLAECAFVDIFVLTLGAALDKAVAELHASSDLLGALFLETAGWLLVEQATRHLRADLMARLVVRGFTVTPRLGPGYDYRQPTGRVRWDLAQQDALFAIFAGADVPVTLMDSGVMLPKMSRSGLFGLRSRRRPAVLTAHPI